MEIFKFMAHDRDGKPLRGWVLTVPYTAAVGFVIAVGIIEYLRWVS